MPKSMLLIAASPDKCGEDGREDATPRQVINGKSHLDKRHRQTINEWRNRGKEPFFYI